MRNEGVNRINATPLQTDENSAIMCAAVEKH